MKIKCPECDKPMVANESEHVCEACDHTIPLDEAETKFNNGELVAFIDEEDGLEEEFNFDKKKDKKKDSGGSDKGEGKEEDGGEKKEKDMKEESFNGFSTKDTWASALISESEYSLYKQIKIAYKKEKLDERFVKSLLDTAKEDKFAEAFESVNLDEVNHKEVAEHFTSLMKEADEIGVDVATALFADVELTEEQKDEVTNIFESAVDIRVNEVRAILKEESETSLADAIEEKNISIEEEASIYLDKKVDEWYSKNEIAIVSSQKILNTQSALDEIQAVFSKHFTNVPEERYDVVEALTQKVEDLETTITESEGKEKELSDTITEMKKSDVLATLSEGMVETEKEKLTQLSETVDYTTDEEFSEKITKLKEAFIDKGNKTLDGNINEKTNVKPTNSIYDDIATAALG